MREGISRTAVTLFALLVHGLCSWIPMPGLKHDVIQEWLQYGYGSQQFSLAVLGLVPWISASVLTELLALVVPSLRQVRLAGHEGRAVIRRWWRLVWLLTVLVQGYALALGLEHMRVGMTTLVAEPGWGFRLVTVLTLAAASAALAQLWWWASRHGWGAGFSIAIAAGAAFQLRGVIPEIQNIVPLEGVLLLGAAVLLAWRRPGVPVPWSAAGIVPLSALTAVLTLVTLPMQVFLLTLATALLAMVFIRPQLVADLWRVPVARVWPHWIRAVVVNAAALIFTAWMAGRWNWELWAVGVGGFIVVAVAWDLVDEVRARRKGPRVVAWELHRVYAVDPALRTLREAGIDADVRGVRLRSLLHIVGPYIPIEVLVPPDRVVESRDLLWRRWELPPRPRSEPPRHEPATTPAEELDQERVQEVRENPWKPL